MAMLYEVEHIFLGQTSQFFLTIASSLKSFEDVLDLIIELKPSSCDHKSSFKILQ